MPPKFPAASSSHPYHSSRKSKGATKSARQQYSACGACRMRRVRCDLKDHYDEALASGIFPSCTNCRERNLKCVDEYADIKTVKALRRGRRLQQVEQVYGTSSPPLDATDLYPLSPTLTNTSLSSIPRLDPNFFQSAFFRHFHTQRPIVDPQEFAARYSEYYNGNEGALSPPGRLIAMLLVIWAASYGVDESGSPAVFANTEDIEQRTLRCNRMLKEALHFVDEHGILRKPTWDGVRALLLLVPLTEGVQPPLDRLVMYESTVSQVYTLCSIGSVSSLTPGHGEFGNALVRARIFWYAHTNEGTNTGLRGGRLRLSEDDLDTFQRSLPPLVHNTPLPTDDSRQYNAAYRLAATPLKVSSTCRDLHACLTGPQARKGKSINEQQLTAAWHALEQCWESFEAYRGMNFEEVIDADELDRFVTGWQIFVFECHNVIRQALKQRLSADSATSSPRASHADDPLAHLYNISEAKCLELLQHIVPLIQSHLNSGFFAYDESLARDGVFFAAFLVAEGHGSENDYHICIQALREYRWAYSKSEEREQTLRLVWNNRVSQKAAMQLPERCGSQSPDFSGSSGSGNMAAYPQTYTASSATAVTDTAGPEPHALKPLSNNDTPLLTAARFGGDSPSSSNETLSLMPSAEAHNRQISRPSEPSSIHSSVSPPDNFHPHATGEALSIDTDVPMSTAPYSSEYTPYTSTPPSAVGDYTGGHSAINENADYYSAGDGTFHMQSSMLSASAPTSSATESFPSYIPYNVEYYLS